ncbi:MAG TPA: hypothetical protein VNZ05_01710, partial [Solirubrobacteraceae bacterium]|nr:hypothetical protein [Solirubrobacteraceae bacterium]
MLAVLLAGIPAIAPAATHAAKKGQTITFKSTAPSPGFVGGTYKVEASASSGFAVSFSSATTPVCTVSGSTVTLVAAGTCTVNANQAGSSEWEAAPQQQQSFSVAKRAQTITFQSTPPSPAFVGATYKVEASASSALAVSFSSATTPVCTVSGATVTLVAAGTCTVNANQAGNGEYEAAPQQQQSFSVVKRAQTVAFKSTAPSPGVVGGTYKVEASASSTLAVSFSSATAPVCTVSGSTVTFVAAGTCTVNANQAGNGEYEAAPQQQQSFSVVKRAQTVAFKSTPPSPAFVGGTYNVEASASSTLAVSFSSATTPVCTVSGSTVTLVAAGTCTVNANQAGNGEFAAAPQQQQSFSVVKRAQTVAFKSAAPSPGLVGGTYKAEASATSTLAVSFSSATPPVCTVSGSTVTLVAAGTCTINANQVGNGEFE